MRAYSVTTGLAGVSDFIHSEYDQTYTSEKRTLLAGSGAARILPQFALAAAIALGAATVTPGAVVGTGNGAIGVVTADAGAEAGTYQVVIIEPASNGGVFEVIRPGGELDGTGTLGAPFNGRINFTLADGATDFVAGDRIPVVVSYADGARDGEGKHKVVQWDPTATNGAQIIIGVNLWEAVAPQNIDGDCTLAERGPLIGRREAIVWHAGVTDEQKAAAYARLSELGIECRQSG